MGGGGGGRVEMNSSSTRLRPAKTEETVSLRQNNDVKYVGTPPMPSNLCTSLIAVSTAVRSELSHKNSVREVTVEDQLKQRIAQLAMRVQLHLPPLDLSWPLSSESYVVVV